MSVKNTTHANHCQPLAVEGSRVGLLSGFLRDVAFFKLEAHWLQTVLLWACALVGILAAEAVLSVADKTWPASDKSLSAAEKTQSMADGVLSVTEATFSSGRKPFP
jgi:hypothetical protein